MKKLFFILCFIVSSTVSAGNVKSARVVEIYPTEMPTHGCLANIPKEELATRQFIKVYYQHSRRLESDVVELPVDMKVNIDDMISIKLGNCTTGNFSRLNL